MVKYEDISIGDEVIFRAKPSQSNYDADWVVTGKIDDLIMVQIDKWGFRDATCITVDEIAVHFPLNRAVA